MNHTGNWKALIAAALITTGGIGARHFAHAQADAPPDGGFGQQGGGPSGPGGGPGGGFGGRGGGFGGPGGGSQMAASGNNVFIIQGATLYRLDATTLEVKARSTLPAPNGAGGAIPQTYGGNGGRSNK